jgi:acetyl esterase/lipase
MKTVFPLLLIFIIIPLLASIQPEQLKDIYTRIDSMPLPTDGVYYDIPYSRDLFNRQTLDIYTSLDNRKDPPLLVYIHGGSWFRGDKKMIRLTSRFLQNLREQGFTVIAINYTSFLYGGLKTPLENCQRALEWIRNRGDLYNYDINRIGIYGVSAGAHLALLTAAEDNNSSTPLRFVLAECGPTDFNAMAEGDAFEASILFRLLTDKTKIKYSPSHQVEDLNVPIMIVHGTQDKTVALNQAHILRDKLREAGKPPEYLEIEGGNHGFINCEEKWPFMENEVLRFMKNSLASFSGEIPPG